MQVEQLLKLVLTLYFASLTIIIPARTAAQAQPSATVHYRFLDRLPEAAIDSPRLNRSFRNLRRHHTYFNRNHFSPHRVQGGRADLMVTLRPSRVKRMYHCRRALYSPASSSFSFSLELPPKAVLSFDTAVLGGRPRFALEISAPLELKQRIFTWQPPRSRARRWHPHQVDLSRYGGRRITLTFSVMDKLARHAFWADPVLLAPPLKKSQGDYNVLFIMIDATRADALGCYGNSRKVSPYIDRLCRRGTRFTNAVANSNWTRPSEISMFAGQYPTRISVNFDGWRYTHKERRDYYNRRPANLPLVLSRKGYLTGAVMNNLFLLGYHQFGVDVGFDEVVDYRRNVQDTIDIANTARRWIRRNRDRKWFLFVNFNAPHVHYVPPAPFLRQVSRPHDRTALKFRKYLGEVAYSDYYAGQLINELKRHGLEKKTLVIISADHGEVFDYKHAYRVVRTGRWSRHGHAVTMYDEEMVVPLIFHLPGVVPRNQVVANQVSLLDLAPTVLEALRLKPNPKYEGKSAWGLIQGKEEKTPRIAFMEGRKMRALRTEGYKYFWRFPGYDRLWMSHKQRYVIIKEELYNLKKDRLEHDNLAGRPEQAGRLVKFRALLKQFMDNVKKPLAHSSALKGSPVNKPGPSVLQKGKASTRPSTSSGEGVKGRTEIRPAAKKRGWGTYLSFNGNGRKHRISGTIRSSGEITRFRLMRHEAMDTIHQSDQETLKFNVLVNGDDDGVYLETRPQDAALDIELSLDGKPVQQGRVLYGPYGLPLYRNRNLQSATEIHIGKKESKYLLAQRPPPYRRGRELGIFIWRGPSLAGRAVAIMSSGKREDSDSGKPNTGALKADNEVEGMLREWGYIQGGKKKKKGGRRR